MALVTILDRLTGETHVGQYSVGARKILEQARAAPREFLTNQFVLAMMIPANIMGRWIVDGAPRLVVTEINGADLPQWLARVRRG